MSIGSFIVFSGVLIIVVSGIVGVVQIKNSTDAIHEDFLPVQESAFRASALLNDGGHIMGDALLSVDEPELYDSVRGYEGQFKQTMISFDMYIKALAWGSESEAFLSSSGGLTSAQWNNAGLDEKLVVKQAPPEVRKLASTADLYYVGFAHNGLKSISSHRKALRLELADQMDEAEKAHEEAKRYREQSERYERLTGNTLDEIDIKVNQFVSELRADIENTQRIVISSLGVLSIILLGLFITFSRIFSRKAIVGPIELLTQGAQAIGRGEFETRINITTNDELQVLGDSFNQMTEYLNESRIELVKANEESRATAKELERSNRELQDFAFVAAHDLQEPLRKIRTFSDRLNKKYSEIIDEKGRDYLSLMDDASVRMGVLIADLLAYSRVTTKAQPFEEVDLDRISKEVVNDLEVRLEQVSGRVEIGELPTILADPTQMRQLIQNLIGNALKFHRADEPPVVKVNTRHLNGSSNGYSSGANMTHPVDDLFQITVEDNGIGFDQEYKEQIFTIFQRLHNREEYEGTGIGLAICRKIVERHGGTIAAESIPSEGTTFVINLPVSLLKIGA